MLIRDDKDPVMPAPDDGLVELRLRVGPDWKRQVKAAASLAGLSIKDYVAGAVNSRMVEEGRFPPVGDRQR